MFKRYFSFAGYFLFPLGFISGLIFYWTVQHFPQQEDLPKGQICLIIDDFGNSLNSDILGFLSLGDNITISILPGHPYSEETAKLAAEKGKEVLVHMPMESWEGIDPDEAQFCLHSGLNPEEYERRVSLAFEEIPNAVGMNNHQGSKATGDPQQMKVLARLLKHRNSFFVDSFTNPDSKAIVTMKKAGVKTGLRQLFLDNLEDEISIRNQLDSLMVIAKNRGSVIGIGHCKPITLKVLREVLPEIENNGFQLVHVSEVVN